MKAKMKIKMGIDFLMTVLLFLLMSYQVVWESVQRKIYTAADNADDHQYQRSYLHAVFGV